MQRTSEKQYADGAGKHQCRMNHLGRFELFTDCVMSPDELTAAYDAVTVQQVQELANVIFCFADASICAVGKTRGEDDYREMILP